MAKPKVIRVANQKSSMSKSTTVYNLGLVLRWERKSSCWIQTPRGI